MSRTTLGSLAAIALLAGLPASAERDGDAAVARLALRHCDGDDRQRLIFLEERLGDNAPYARWWWRSWNAVYVLGMGFEGTRAALEDDDRGERANSIASAAKAAIGLTRGLWSPPTAKDGSEGLVPVRDAESCRERVALAEERLRESADEARSERWGWVSHAANLALNGAAAVIVAEEYDHDAAYWSGALGFAMGEVRLWTFPWQAQDDLGEYERRFDDEAGPLEPETSLGIEPWSSGARLVVRF